MVVQARMGSRSVSYLVKNKIIESIVNVSFLYFNWFKHFSPIYPLSGKLSRSSSSQSPIHLSYGLVEGHAAGDRRRIRLARPTIQLKGKNESPSTVGVNFSGGFVWSVCRAPFFVDPRTKILRSYHNQILSQSHPITRMPADICSPARPGQMSLGSRTGRLRTLTI